MAKVKYYAKENSTIGTHSFYAVPIPNGTLTFDELLDEAMDGKSVEPSIAKACVTEFMKAVKRNVLKGFRCQLGDNFLTVYPNLQLSVKDTEDPQTHAPIVATVEKNGWTTTASSIKGTLTFKIPSGANYIKVDGREYDALLKLDSKRKLLEKERDEFGDQVYDALVALRTEKAVEKELPEAMKYLVFPEVKAVPMPVFTGLRDIIGKIKED